MTIEELREAPPTIGLMEAAEVLGISRTIAYREAKQGALFPGVPVYRVGGKYRVPTSFVLNALGIEREVAA